MKIAVYVHKILKLMKIMINFICSCWLSMNKRAYNLRAWFCGSSRNGVTGADPEFLESGFICIKVWGVLFADFISFVLNIP